MLGAREPLRAESEAARACAAESDVAADVDGVGQCATGAVVLQGAAAEEDGPGAQGPGAEHTAGNRAAGAELQHAAGQVGAAAVGVASQVHGQRAAALLDEHHAAGDRARPGKGVGQRAVVDRHGDRAHRAGEAHAAGGGRVVEKDRVAVAVGRRAAADGPVRRAGVPGRAVVAGPELRHINVQIDLLAAGVVGDHGGKAGGQAADQQRAAVEGSAQAAVAHQFIRAGGQAAGVLDIERSAVEFQGAADSQQVAAVAEVEVGHGAVAERQAADGEGADAAEVAGNIHARGDVRQGIDRDRAAERADAGQGAEADRGRAADVVVGRRQGEHARPALSKAAAAHDGVGNRCRRGDGDRRRVGHRRDVGRAEAQRGEGDAGRAGAGQGDVAVEVHGVGQGAAAAVVLQGAAAEGQGADAQRAGRQRAAGDRAAGANGQEGAVEIEAAAEVVARHAQRQRAALEDDGVCAGRAGGEGQRPGTGLDDPARGGAFQIGRAAAVDAPGDDRAARPVERQIADDRCEWTTWTNSCRRPRSRLAGRRR